jgi:hypothetical protein
LLLACGTTSEGGDDAPSASESSALASDDDSSGQAPDLLVCAPACDRASDCCPPGVDCPGVYPHLYECVDNACVNLGCRDDDDCRPLQTGQACAPVAGTSVCVVICENACAESDVECIGATEDGRKFCRADRPACTADADCGGSDFCDLSSGRCRYRDPACADAGGEWIVEPETEYCACAASDDCAPGMTCAAG